MGEIGPLRRKGLRRLGDVYFPTFSRRGSDRHIDLLVATLTATEKRDVNLMLVAATVCPTLLIRLLFLCEREGAPRLLVRMAGPLHIQMKGLCSLLNFADDKQILAGRASRE